MKSIRGLFQQSDYAGLAELIENYSGEIYSDDVWVWRNVAWVKDDLPDMARDDLALVLAEIFVRMIRKGVRVEVMDIIYGDVPPEVTHIISLLDHEQPHIFAQAMVEYVLDHPDYGKDGGGFWISSVPIEVRYDPASDSYRDLDLYIESRSNDVFVVRYAPWHIQTLPARVREDIPQMDSTTLREVLIRIIVAMAGKAEVIEDRTAKPHADVAPILAGIRENPQQWAGPLLDFIEAHPDYGLDDADTDEPGGIVFFLADDMRMTPEEIDALMHLLLGDEYQ